jgi:hypothetical protein
VSHPISELTCLNAVERGTTVTLNQSIQKLTLRARTCDQPDLFDDLLSENVTYSQLETLTMVYDMENAEARTDSVNNGTLWPFAQRMPHLRVVCVVFIDCPISWDEKTKNKWIESRRLLSTARSLGLLEISSAEPSSWAARPHV